MDLGPRHYPRYLLSAVCQSLDLIESKIIPSKCWPGSICRPLEYKVKILSHRDNPTVDLDSYNNSTINSRENGKQLLIGHGLEENVRSELPESLRLRWYFKTVTVAVGCFCS